jgi:hypothetical protein
VDLPFLQESFAKLLLNFTWWVNRKDPSGRNVFEGGFLGLDNIGVFDRSATLPTGGRLEQADGTAWMAMFSQDMLQLAVTLLEHDETYEGFVLKFVEHFFWIAAAVDPIGEHPDEMWDEEDGFFYDVLRLPDGTGARLKVRSLVGLLPLCATTVIEDDVIDRYPQIAGHVAAFIRRNQDLLANIADPFVPGVHGRRLLSLVNEDKLRRILARMLDEERFLGPHGIRSVSRWHLEHPYAFDVAGTEHRVQYEPAESTSGMFGGNSNWRGPVWFPVNLLLIRALIQHYRYYGNDMRVECPTGSGTMMTLRYRAQGPPMADGPAVPAPRRRVHARCRHGSRSPRRDRTTITPLRTPRRPAPHAPRPRSAAARRPGPARARGRGRTPRRRPAPRARRRRAPRRCPASSSR